MNKIQIAIFLVLGVALVVSAVTDLRTRKIRDVVTLPALALCLGLRLASAGWGEATAAGLFSGVIGLLIGGAFFLVLALMGGMGGGDVKLMAAVGAAVGFPTVLACLVCVGLVGGLQAILALLWDGQLFSTLAGMARPLLKLARIAKGEGAQRLPPRKIPYGVAIALGTGWGVWWSLTQASAEAQGVAQ